MLLVVFGAGASYDSVLQVPPPDQRIVTISNHRVFADLAFAPLPRSYAKSLKHMPRSPVRPLLRTTPTRKL
jgi:hypothetical protein